jgi:hypothetical protein
MNSKIYMFIIIILFVNTKAFAREINNLLTNDLNIIASKLDDIPFTNLNVQLVLLAYNCRDLLITWNVGASEGTPAMKSTSSVQATTNNGHYYTLGGNKATTGTSTESPSSHSKPFGFQIVVREYLNIQDNNNDDDNNKSTRNINKTMRLYTSKYIDVNAKQNKFKLRNLLFNNVANYDICLVIYFDVIETVAFEKQCVS